MIIKKRKKEKPFDIGEKQEAAAKLLADRKCYAKQEVADMIGVHRTTLWRWLQHKEYWRYCERIHSQVLDEFTRDAMEVIKQRRMEQNKRMKAMEKEYAEEIFEAEYKKLDNWLHKNHCPETDRKEALKAFEEQHKNEKH